MNRIFKKLLSLQSKLEKLQLQIEHAEYDLIEFINEKTISKDIRWEKVSEHTSKSSCTEGFYVVTREHEQYSYSNYPEFTESIHIHDSVNREMIVSSQNIGFFLESLQYIEKQRKMLLQLEF